MKLIQKRSIESWVKEPSLDEIMLVITPEVDIVDGGTEEEIGMRSSSVAYTIAGLVRRDFQLTVPYFVKKITPPSGSKTDPIPYLFLLEPDKFGFKQTYIEAEEHGIRGDYEELKYLTKRFLEDNVNRCIGATVHNPIHSSAYSPHQPSEKEGVLRNVFVANGRLYIHSKGKLGRIVR